MLFYMLTPHHVLSPNTKFRLATNLFFLERGWARASFSGVMQGQQKTHGKKIIISSFLSFHDQALPKVAKAEFYHP